MYCDSRAQVKRVLYMAAGIRSKPVIRTLYAGLRKLGRYREPAVTVCRREILVILNAILSLYRHLLRHDCSNPTWFAVRGCNPTRSARGYTLQI